MSRRPTNPIPFNPDTMTVAQLKEAAETLRMIFDGIDRGVDATNIVHNADYCRRAMITKWEVR